MEAKVLGAEAAFSEISRLEFLGEEGVVINIAEKLWAGCAPDNAYSEEVRSELDIPIFHSDYRPGMVDLVFPGDLCICAVEAVSRGTGNRIFKAVEDYLRKKGILARARNSDFMLADIPAKKVWKIGSYGVIRLANGMWETTVHISITADRKLIEKFRDEPPEMPREGLGKYGVTAEELLAAITEADPNIFDGKGFL